MSASQKKQPQKKKQPKVTKRASASKGASTAAPSPPRALPHEPGVFPGAVDVIGFVPEDVHVDPDITEGQPGYEESGDSEIHPSR
jgi:hypothetical protein